MQNQCANKQSTFFFATIHKRYTRYVYIISQAEIKFISAAAISEHRQRVFGSIEQSLENGKPAKAASAAHTNTTRVPGT